MFADEHRKRKEAEQRARLESKRDAIRRMCGRLPASHITWSAQQARDFKAAARNGMAVAANPRATEALLDSAVRRLESFYF